MTSGRRVVSGIALLLLLSVGATIRATATWTFSGNVPVSRAGGVAFLLPNANVLVIGGVSSGTSSDASTDLFDPATATWSAGPPSPSRHPQEPAGVLLLDGRLLVSGGRIGSDSVEAADIYNASTNTWTATGAMNRGRVGHTLTLLPDGRVLAAGGWSTELEFDNTAEIYNPATGTWNWTNAMAHGKWFHSANLMSDGRVLVVGGEHYYDGLGPHFRLTEFYDPSTGAWTAGPQLTVGRADHQTAFLPDGRLMVVGGLNGFGINAPLASTEIFDGCSWQSGPSMAQPRLHFPLVLMSDGALLVTGGTTANTNPQAVTAATERYDAATNAWTSSGVMNSPRRLHVAAQLADGQVMVAGGHDGSVYLLSSEIMTPNTPPTPSIAPDTTPPATNANVPQPNSNGWNRFNVNVFLCAVDSGGAVPPSGVQSISYSLSGAQTGGGTFNTSSTSFDIVNEGITTVTYHATDNRGNVEADQTLTVKLDKTAPSAANVANITVSATSPAGAVVTFDLALFDDFSGIDSVNFNQGLPSGSTFPHGSTFENVVITDKAGNSTFRSFSVMVNRGLLSIAVLPSTATINPGQGGQQFQAMGHFTDGSDLVLPGGSGGGSSLPTVSWQSTNQSVAGISSSGFATGNALGQTTIIASADGITCQPTGCATLTIADTTPPNLFVPSQPFFATATSAAGTTVDFGTAVTAFDSVDGNVTPSCTPSSGSLFAIGSTTVSCQAIDAHLNASPIQTFTVQVSDGLTLFVPSNIVAEATGAAGTGVPFSVSATYFLGGSEPVQCFIITGFVNGNPQIGPAVSSGATFPLGATTVGCQSTSSTGQHSGNFFTITVQDTTPPVVTTSGNVTTNATSVAGAVATFTASAVDVVDGPRPVTCAPASGSMFVIGATTVTCSASDANQNTGSATLTVTIVSPTQIITNLVSQASAASFQQGGTLLQNALQNAAAGNLSSACSQLSAFINQVQAQSGKSLTVADAAALSQSAMEAKAAMGCG